MSERRVFDVFGTRMQVERTPAGWQLFSLGPDGKRSPMAVGIPASLGEDELEQYLFDVFHEMARPRHPSVRRVNDA